MYRISICSQPGSHRAGKLAYDQQDHPATYHGVPVSLLILDIDGLPLRQNHDIRHPVTMIHEALALLGAGFTQTHCYWQLTASQHPNAERLYARLYFLLDHPLSLAAIKRWANTRRQDACVDPAIYSPVQMIYTARPGFIDMDDPIPWRSGLLYGQREQLPTTLLRVKLPERSRAKIQPTKMVSDVPFLASHFGERWISRIGSEGFYPMIRGLIACAAWYSGYQTDWESLKQAIRQKVSFCDPDGRNTEYLRTITTNASLDSLIQGAVRKFAR
ncbi:hypothetical protein [Endozoicomonas acroporae]|uniref:hypothetical protein n=1 Tax=Endozoicomonas acroporae TaxID=1701104 RepID=UPI003D7B7778